MDYEEKWMKLRNKLNELMAYAHSCSLKEEENTLKMVKQVMNTLEQENNK